MQFGSKLVIPRFNIFARAFRQAGQTMKKTRVLLIGAGGQLGSELTQALRPLYGADNVISSDVKDAQGTLKDGPYIKFDVLQRDKLFEIIRKNEITQVYHLAALLSATGEKDPRW